MQNMYEIESLNLCKCEICEIYKVRSINAPHNILIAKIFPSQTNENYIKERNIFNHLNYAPNIIHLNNGNFQIHNLNEKFGNNAVCLFFNYLNRGKLNDYLTFLNARNDFTEEVVKFIGYRLILAIQALHQNNIAHNNLNLANIMLDGNYNPIIIHLREASTNVNNNADFSKDFKGLAEILIKLISNGKFGEYKVQTIGNKTIIKVYFSIGAPVSLDKFWKTLISDEPISQSFKDFFKTLILGNNLNINNILNHPWLQGINNDLIFLQQRTTQQFNRIHDTRIISRDGLNTQRLDYSDIIEDNDKVSISLFDENNMRSEPREDLSKKFSELKIRSIKFKPMGNSFEYLILEVSNFNCDYSFFNKYIFELYSDIDQIKDLKGFKLEKNAFEPTANPFLLFEMVIYKIYENEDFDDNKDKIETNEIIEENDDEDKSLIINVELVEYRENIMDGNNNINSNKNIFYLLFDYKKGEISYYYYLVNIFKEKAISLLKKKLK